MLFCSTNAIFLVCRKKFERAVQTFASLWREFCRLIVQVLPFLPSYAKFLKHSTQVCCIFLGGGRCKSHSMDSLLLSKIPECLFTTNTFKPTVSNRIFSIATFVARGMSNTGGAALVICGLFNSLIHIDKIGQK